MSTLFLFLLISLLYFLFFFFNDTATTEIYTLSLHDALPISVFPFRGSVRQSAQGCQASRYRSSRIARRYSAFRRRAEYRRSEEHTSELQSHSDLVCRLLLEKKKKKTCTTKTNRTHHRYELLI